MAEKALNATLHGQFGSAVYNVESQAWEFVRSSAQERSLRQLGDSVTSVPPARNWVPLYSSQSNTHGPSQRRENQVKALVKQLPGLQPASELLPGLARLSESVEDATQRYDSTTGKLLDFGLAIDQSSRHVVPVVAFATGPTGSDVGITRVAEHHRIWKNDASVRLTEPIASDEQATWAGPGVPIQSLTFASTLMNKSSFLAVRLPLQILIFRPSIGTEARKVSGKLDTNFLFALNIAQSFGFPSADVAFNPWCSRQFAIVDVTGNYSVFNIGQREEWHADSVHSGSLVVGSKSVARDLADDGWARVSWILGSQILLVCNRYVMRAYRFLKRGADDGLDLDVPLDPDGGWILDFRLIVSHPDRFVLLTSTHLVIYTIGQESNGSLSRTLLAHVRHYRNTEDISLSLHLDQNTDDILVLILSKIEQVMTSHWLRVVDSQRITVDSATMMILPAFRSSTGRHNRILDIHAEKLSLVSKRDHSSSRSAAHQYEAQGGRFYSITVLCHDLSVRHALYHLCDSKHLYTLEPPLLEKPKRKKIVKSTARISEDDDSLADFIVDDEELEQSETSSRGQAPISKFPYPRTRALSRSGQDWRMNFQLTVQRLNEVNLDDVTDVSEVIEEALNRLRFGDAHSQRRMKTMRELVSHEISLNHIEGAVTKLHNLEPISMKHSEERRRPSEDGQSQVYRQLAIRPFRCPPFLDMPYRNGDAAELSSIHNTIVQEHVASLTKDVPEMIALTRRQLAGRVAAEIALASRIIRTEDNVQNADSHSQSEAQPGQQALVHRPASEASTTRLPVSSIDDPTPSGPSTLPTPSATSSTITTSSSLLKTSSPELSRLSHYTSFSKPPPTSLPSSLQKVLSHWQLGADPSNYNWHTTTTTSHQPDSETEEMSTKERERVQRRAQRYIKRQRREAEESERLRVRNTQAPEIFSASQPSVRGREMESQPTDFGLVAGSSQSQSQSQGDGVSRRFPASQVLPGRFGGRGPPARKKRKSGF